MFAAMNTLLTPPAAGVGTWSFTDLFGSTRANMTALNADGYVRAGSAANGTDGGVGGFSVGSGDLNKVCNGDYHLFLQTTNVATVADYSVEVIIPHSQRATAYQFIVLRWNGTTGVRVGLGGSSTIVFGTANGASNGDSAGTTDGGLNWVGTGDHKMRVVAAGSLIQLYLDDVLAAHATNTTNQATTNTGFGMGGGNAFVYRSLIATQ